MDFLTTLGIALGLAMLAGINLYLTIFITGLAVRIPWFADTALVSALEGFGHPAVIAVSLGLYLVQFIADKVPWVDSLWDSIHTFLKPAGGVLLALTSLGPDAGTLTHVVVTMLALAGSLLTHGVKAGTRLTINTSPEPFSNIGASVFEDLLVVGGFAMLIHHPKVAFFIFAPVLAIFVLLTPRVMRSIRAILWLIWKKLRVPADDKSGKKKDFPHKISADAELLLVEEFGSESYNVVWSLPCVSGKTRNAGRLCRNLFGNLVLIRERPGKLFFIGARNFSKFVQMIELGGSSASHESHFISEEVVVQNKESKLYTSFRFHRGQEELAERVTDHLQAQIAVEESSEPKEIEDQEEMEEVEEIKEEKPVVAGIEPEEGEVSELPSLKPLDSEEDLAEESEEDEAK